MERRHHTTSKRKRTGIDQRDKFSIGIHNRLWANDHLSFSSRHWAVDCWLWGWLLHQRSPLRTIGIFFAFKTPSRIAHSHHNDFAVTDHNVRSLQCASLTARTSCTLNVSTTGGASFQATDLVLPSPLSPVTQFYGARGALLAFTTQGVYRAPISSPSTFTLATTT